MNSRRARRSIVPFALVVAGLLVASCTGSGPVSGGGATRTAGGVRPFASIATLRDAFDADAGTTRLILLVSPT